MAALAHATERPARARQRLAPAPRPDQRPAAAPVATRATRLSALAGRWWTALEAAESALHAAAPALSGSEFAERSKRLADERREALQQLQGLAHDLQADSRLLRLLTASRPSKQALGLPSTVEACVCDLDGVLTTSGTLHAAAWAETLDPFLLERAEHAGRDSIPFDPIRDYDDYLAGRPRLAGIRAFLASRGLDLPDGTDHDPPGHETVHALANRKNQALQRQLEHGGVAALEGVHCYLEAAHILGLHRAVVSPSTHTDTILERAGLTELIDLRIDADAMTTDGVRSKPAADALLAATRELDLEFRQIAAFETSLAGVATARAAGAAYVVAVSDGHTPTLGASDADLVVRSLAELLDRNQAPTVSRLGAIPIPHADRARSQVHI